jgi:hypothetical protein
MKIAIIVTLIAALSCLATAYRCGYKNERKDGKNEKVPLECKETEVCCEHSNDEMSFLTKCIDCGLFKACPTNFKLAGIWGSDAKCQAKKKQRKLK